MVGTLTQGLFLLKDLPLAYNRDLQEDKVPLFEAYDTLSACLELAAKLVSAQSCSVSGSPPGWRKDSSTRPR